MKQEDLKSLIREAFKNVEYPGDDHIARCGRSDTPIGCDECDGIADYFRGTTWQQHSSQTLTGCDDAVLLFEIEALHYYLPAFMIAEIDDSMGDCLPNVYDAIEYFYWPWGGVCHQKKCNKYINLLSTTQRLALVEYFKYHCTDTDEGAYNPNKRILEIIDFLQG